MGKIFQGAGYDEVVQDLKSRFRRVKGIKPRAVRKESKEIFLVAMEKRELPI
jgi:23S rRNA (uridine2552-2'-O)-methyltransferase